MADETAHLMPRPAVLGIGVGLLVMAVFTLFWSSLATAGWPDARGWTAFALFAAVAVAFAVLGIRVLTASRRYPSASSPEDVARGRRMSRDFGIVGGVEGAVIGIVCGVLGATGRTNAIVPAAALVVGLHFLPMARIFDRRIDYWIGAWVTAVAVAALVTLAAGHVPAFTIWAATGVGTALGTTAYGVYMAREARRVLGRV